MAAPCGGRPAEAVARGRARDAAPLRGRARADPPFSFDARWHDGRAELDGYRLDITRYGAPRRGQAVLVYVTEPWSASHRVKLDEPSRHPGDVVDVLKLNLVREFQTGIYDYHTMVSLFVRTADFQPLKVSFTSAEWCGNVTEELRFDFASVIQHVASYFEGESGDRALGRPRGGIEEDELYVRLRGLRGPWLEPGETRTLPFLPGPFVRRLRHVPAAWGSATVTRRRDGAWLTVPAGRFAVDTYDVTTSDGRQARFHVERAAPHRIVRWQWSAARTGFRAVGETARLAGSARLAYWTLNRPGGERFLDTLGLAPIVR